MEIKSKNNNLLLVYWILGGLAVIAIIYSFLMVLPYFHLYFYDDDIWMFDDAAMLRQVPFGFLFHTSNDLWWRPLAFAFISYSYYLFGLNPVVFHWLVWLVHLAAALALFLFVRRFFNLPSAFISFTIFLISPLMLSSIGYIRDTPQDELAAVLLFLSSFFLIRKQNTVKNRLYIVPALFWGLALLCKETAFGFLPALIYLDWIKHPVDRLSRRLVRLLPFTIFLLLIPLRFLFVGDVIITQSSKSQFYLDFNLLNFLWMWILAFLPIALQKSQITFNWILGLIPLSIFFIAIKVSGQNKNKIRFLLMAFLGVSIVLFPTAMYLTVEYWLHQWARMPILVGIASVVIAISINYIISFFKLRFLYLGTYFSVLFIYGLLSFNMNQKEASEVENFAKVSSIRHNNLIKSVIFLPKGSKVYILYKKIVPVNLVCDIARRDEIEVVLLLKADPDLLLLHNPNPINEHIKLVFSSEHGTIIQRDFKIPASNYFLMSDEEYIAYVKSLTQNSSVHLIKFDGISDWKDVTEDYRK